MNFAEHFTPCDDIAVELAPYALGAVDDGSHDVSHLLRVWRNVHVISAQEGGDHRILAAATLLHDCVDIAKDSPLRSSSSHMAAEKALEILSGLGWKKDTASMVAHAIEAHSFSAGIEPKTLEAKILQDADRLDAIGYIGIARCFYVSGRLGRAIYDPQDPAASNRDLDDLTFAIDHFQTKLMRLSASFQTLTGGTLAAKRHETVQKFLRGLLLEVSADQNNI